MGAEVSYLGMSAIEGDSLGDKRIIRGLSQCPTGPEIIDLSDVIMKTLGTHHSRRKQKC